MIERYTRPEMGAIWTEENKFQAWLEVEIVACEAWAELGDIPKEDVAKIRENAGFDINRINEIELETRHDVVAFTRAVSETLGEERKWVHYGLTSTDVVDTALSYLLKQANDILLADIERFIEILKNKAQEHKYTVMMGRTHGVHAEPTTFGLKLALWYEEMKRNLERFKHAAEGVRVGKLSGAVGTFANIDPSCKLPRFLLNRSLSKRWFVSLSQRRHVSGEISSAKRISPSDVRPNSSLKSIKRTFKLSNKLIKCLFTSFAFSLSTAKSAFVATFRIAI